VLAVLALLLAPPGSAADSAPACPVIDATAGLAAAARSSAGRPESEQLAAYRHALVDQFPGLYAPQVLQLEPGAAMDHRILRALDGARASADDRAALKQQLTMQIAATTAAFALFKDFRCNFPIYLADTLGQMDGAGRVVDGRRAMVLGLDVLEKEQNQISLPVFFTHEFFHRYHFQASGFSDDLADRQEIWRNLWAEGLATYVSQVLTPGATRTEALMLPQDLAERAQPLMPRMSAELLAGLDRIDAQLFAKYFTSNPNLERAGLPPRAGYYVGYRVAQRLARRYSLDELAHLSGRRLQRNITRTLRELARS
jgi:uncharacterized protein YjaZ